MRLRTIFVLVSTFLVLRVAAGAQDSPIVPNVATNKVTLQPFATNPVPASNAVVQRVGNPGHRTIYYWIVANYTVGNASVAGPFPILNAADSLDGFNYVTIAASLDPSASSYDVLKTLTPTAPAGACACAVATAVAPGTVTNDQSNTTSSYTVNPIDMNTLGVTLTPEVQSAGVVHLILRQNGAFVCDLSVGCTGAGGGVALAGDLCNTNLIPWVCSTHITGFVQNAVPKFNNAGNLIPSLASDDGNTFLYTGSGGITVDDGSGNAGIVNLVAGNTQGFSANAVGITVPTLVTPWNLVLPGAACSGLLQLTNSTNEVTTACVSAPVGYTLQINGSTLTAGDTVNFNNSTPALDPNSYRITVNKSTASTTDSVSYELTGDGNAAHFLNGSGTFSTPTGTTVSVNGSTVANPNFNFTTPAAGANSINVNWQVSGSSVSGQVTGDGIATDCLLGTGIFSACPGGGTITAAVRMPIFLQNPQTVNNSQPASNVFPTTAPVLSNGYEWAHWEFANNAALSSGTLTAVLFDTITIPHNMHATPAASIVCRFAPTTTVGSGNVKLQLGDFIVNSGGNFNGTFTTGTAQVVAVTTTADKEFDVTFTPSSTLAADGVLKLELIRVSSDAADTYAANLALDGCSLQITEDF